MEYIKTPKVENVRLIENHSRNKDIGTLYLTATHLIFVDSERKKEQWIVHSHIQNVEKLNLVQSGSPLRLRCKNFQVLNFIVAQERDCHDLYSSLMKLSKPVKLSELYAFSYNPREEQLAQHEGWDIFKLNNDFLQMGLPTLHWKISRINQDFDICETYPPIICVPSLATPALLLGSAAFRSKRRLPVLSYMHQRNSAVIVRCSQPMSGLNSRSIEDEAYVDLIRRSKPRANDFMYIVDTRPMINAMANRAQGKGYENTDVYENIKYHFLGIDNIHVMRSSLNKMLEICWDSNCSTSAWLDGLNSSGWQRHVHSVLQVSRFIAHAVGVEGRSVLVHCSDGWDRTAQVCSLASIMLEQRYRTIDGFLALVQREWLDFGHKFSHRCGHLDGDSREVSPIFTQFIDAVWQLLRLKPTWFQFNEKMLMDLHDHAYSCQFGTFLGNCARERITQNLSTRTYSLWGWMVKRVPLYTNPFYDTTKSELVDGKKVEHLLLPPTTPHFVKFWLAMYNRHTLSLQPREHFSVAMETMNSDAAKLEAEVTSLRKARNMLRSALGLRKKSEDQTIGKGTALSGAVVSVNHTILSNNNNNIKSRSNSTSSSSSTPSAQQAAESNNKSSTPPSSIVTSQATTATVDDSSSIVVFKNQANGDSPSSPENSSSTAYASAVDEPNESSSSGDDQQMKEVASELQRISTKCEGKVES